MNDLSFAHPWVLFTLLPLAGVAVLWWRSRARASTEARSLSRTASSSGSYFPAVLLGLAAIAAVAAALGPRWGERQAPVERRGGDIVFVIDVSRSMAAQDVEPDRMTVARHAIVSSLNRLAGDRVGVVVFGGDARIRFPLTTDIDGASQVIASLRPGSVLVEGGTDAAGGLALAGDMLAETEAGGLVVLVTDGDNLGADPIGAATELGEAGMELVVLATGTAEGGTVPILDSATREFVPKPGPDGQPLISRVDEALLSEVAGAAGGRYLGTSPSALPGAVQAAASELADRRLAESAITRPVERFQWFAGAALILLVLAFVAETPPRPAALARPLALLVPILLVACATRAHDLDVQGRDAYSRGDYNAAVTSFLEARAEAPSDHRIGLNLASALHQAGRYGEAVSAARRVLLEGNDEQRQLAFAGLGRSWFALGDLEAALAAFQQALLLEPGDDVARHDYEVVFSLLTREDEEPPPPGGEAPGIETPGAEDPGEGDPGSEPGQPEPGDGDGDGEGEGPPRGQPATEDAIDRTLRDLDERIAELREAAGVEVSAEEALEILDLLAERSEVAALRDGLAGGQDPGDY